MEQVFNKLIRDKIKDKIESNGEVAITRILNDNEYKIELLKKLKEECNEVLESKTVDELLEELADVYEVLNSICILEGKTIADVIELANLKKEKRGSFEKRIFLEKTYKKEE